MLRTAALASIILENWSGPLVDSQAIINALLLHDIAKPMTFDLTKQAQFGMSAEDIEKLKQLQDFLTSHYGKNEHQATVRICSEVCHRPKVAELVNNLEWKYIPRLMAEKNLESLLPIYMDMRIGPKGILPLTTRVEELRQRTSEEDYEANLTNGLALEKHIQENVGIDLNSVTSEQLTERFVQLRDQEL
jgi:hypothetical protein